MTCAKPLLSSLSGNYWKPDARVRVYDPEAMNECRRRLGDAVIYARDMYEAALDADALLLVTEWKEFRLPVGAC